MIAGIGNFDEVEILKEIAIESGYFIRAVSKLINDIQLFQSWKKKKLILIMIRFLQSNS